MKKFLFTTNELIKVLSCLFIVIVSLTSCSQKMQFQVSPVVPSAEGSVKVKSDKNNNYAIEVSVSNLATPDRLTPPMHEYVV